jgi:hypothetical protein
MRQTPRAPTAYTDAELLTLGRAVARRRWDTFRASERLRAERAARGPEMVRDANGAHMTINIEADGYCPDCGGIVTTETRPLADGAGVTIVMTHSDPPLP